LIYRISVANQNRKNQKIKEISIAFNKEDEYRGEGFNELHTPMHISNANPYENETLKPLRELYHYSQPLKPNEFLTEQSFIERIKDKIAFAATIPPLVISIFEMYTRLKGG
jgi:hypothetical protein